MRKRTKAVTGFIAIFVFFHLVLRIRKIGRKAHHAEARVILWDCWMNQRNSWSFRIALNQRKAMNLTSCVFILSCLTSLSWARRQRNSCGIECRLDSLRNELIGKLDDLVDAIKRIESESIEFKQITWYRLANVLYAYLWDNIREITNYIIIFQFFA